MLPAQPPKSRRSWGQERDVQDVQLVGQDLVGKAPLEVMMVSNAREPQIKQAMVWGGGAMKVRDRRRSGDSLPPRWHRRGTDVMPWRC
jgi:hypothetical protein